MGDKVGADEPPGRPDLSCQVRPPEPGDDEIDLVHVVVRLYREVGAQGGVEVPCLRPKPGVLGAGAHPEAEAPCLSVSSTSVLVAAAPNPARRTVWAAAGPGVRSAMSSQPVLLLGYFTAPAGS